MTPIIQRVLTLALVLGTAGVARATDPPKPDEFQRALTQAVSAPPPAAAPRQQAPERLRTPLGANQLHIPLEGVEQGRRNADVAFHNRLAIEDMGYAAPMAVDERTVDAAIRANTTAHRSREAHHILGVEQHDAQVAGQRYALVTAGVREAGHIANDAARERSVVLAEMNRYDQDTLNMVSRAGHDKRSWDRQTFDLADRALGPTFGGLYMVLFDPSREDKERLNTVNDQRIERNAQIQAGQTQYLAGLDNRIADLRTLQGDLLNTGRAIQEDQARRASDHPRVAPDRD